MQEFIAKLTELKNECESIENTIIPITTEKVNTLKLSDK